MKTVYIVTQGEYSDYSIIGVFSTRAIAKRFMKAYAMDQDGLPSWIEEWKLDVNSTELRAGLKPYDIRIDAQTGELDTLSAPIVNEKPGVYRTFVDRGTGHTYLLCLILARDEVHALKIAGDLRTRWLAEHAEVT